MRKGATALVVVLLVASSMLAGFLDVNLAKANPSVIPPMPQTPDLNEPSIIVQLPEHNMKYKINTVPCSITVKPPSSWFDVYPVHGMIMTIDYVLDGNQRVEIADEPPYYERGPFTYEGTLSGLSEGNHSVEVYVRSDSFYDPPDKPRSTQWPWGKMPPQDYYLDTYSDKVNFTIDTTLPIISVLSVENKTFNQTEVPLDFVLSEPTSAISYSLDNHRNWTIVGNTTLTGLSTGAHNLTVYAWDTAGNVGASQTIDFTATETEENQPSEPFPPSLVVVASGTLLAVVAVAVLVYWRKRKVEAEQ